MRHFKVYAAAVLLFTFLLTACGGAPEASQPEDAQSADVPAGDENLSQISLIVSSNLVRCVGVGDDCLQVKFSPEGDWEALQSRIEGFEYELGYRYVLLVEEVEEQAEDAVGAKVQYKLVQVQEKAKEVEVNADDLGGTFWVLSTFGGLAEPDAASPQAQVSFKFDPEKNKIAGIAGCNNYIANASVDYALLSLDIDTVGTTRMACREEVMQQELHFLAMLDRVASYAVEDGVLYLFTTEGEVLTFSPGQPSR